MNIITKTNRLYLRELTPNDAAHFYSLNSNKNVIKYTGDKTFSSIKNAHDFLNEYIKQYELYNMARWAVCLKESNEMIGWCGLKYHEKENLVDVGYRFHEEHWSKGYATEATIASISYGFNNLNLKEIVAHVHVDNKASHKVVLKSGMKFVKDFMYDNKPAKLYSIKA